ncbi:MAG: heme o synthase [Cytophagaceae bacterium]|nr:heme o synthase [Cytophagaceae bacterium]
MLAGKINLQILLVQQLEKMKAYFQLFKFRLASLVVFSGGVGYALGAKSENVWSEILLFSLGGLLVTGSSNTINQIMEKDLDKLMKRTMNRPLPKEVISVTEALVFSMITGFAGIFIFACFFNFNTAALALLSLLLYAFAYTPMKTKSPVAVLIGAFPGALPPMIGWVAVTNQYGLEPGILFAIQFIWQFPHFWAIAWVLDDDYKKAGIKLLPSAGGKDMNTAFKIMIYTLLLIPLGFMPWVLGMTGIESAMIALICGILFLAQTFYLMKECTNKAALYIMFGSFFYLPIVQIAFLFNKI